MESMDTIRKELKEVRYYYANREMFDQAAKDVGENEIIKTSIDITQRFRKHR